MVDNGTPFTILVPDDAPFSGMSGVARRSGLSHDISIFSAKGAHPNPINRLQQWNDLVRQCMDRERPRGVTKLNRHCGSDRPFIAGDGFERHSAKRCKKSVQVGISYASSQSTLPPADIFCSPVVTDRQYRA